MKNNVGLIVLAAGLAHGSTILLQSGVSNGEFNNFGSNIVIPMLEPAWAPDQGGASWVSYENTGWSSGGTVIALPNAGSQSTPNAEFFQTFTDVNSPLTLNITVWADDTAVLYLDGVQKSPNPNLTQVTGTDCESTGITCTGAGTSFTFSNLAAGTHTLEFDVYQAGGGTYGVMYTGTVTDSAQSLAPEPGSYVLLGMGLVILALFRVKRAF